MKRKVSVCAGVMAAVVAFSAGAEEKVAEAPGAAPLAPTDAGVVDGPGADRVLVSPPLVAAATAGSVAAAPAAPTAPAADTTAAKEAEPAEVHVPFSFSLLPGLSTSGMRTGNVVNTVSIGLLATHAKRVHGGAFALGANWVDDGMSGVQVAVGANVSKGPVSGGQFAVGGNVSGGELTGAQFSVGSNIVRGRMEGGQFTVGGNLVAGAVEGAQVGVGVNVATGGLLGAQLGVGANIAAGPARGLQASAGVNIAGDMSGVQLSSGISYARHLSGAQLSIINVGGAVEGAQVGLVNVAGSVDGAQVGLLNFAGKTEGEAVGLLSFVGNGQHHVQVWGSDVALMNVGLKLGGRHLYTLLTAGFTPPRGGERRHYTLGAGFGGHIPAGRFFVDIDVLGSSLHSGSLFYAQGEHVLGQLRLMAGFHLARRFALFGGVSANTLVTWDGSDRWEDLGIGPQWREFADGGRTTVRTWPGVLAGIQL